MTDEAKKDPFAGLRPALPADLDAKLDALDPAPSPVQLTGPGLRWRQGLPAAPDERRDDDDT